MILSEIHSSESEDNTNQYIDHIMIKVFNIVLLGESYEGDEDLQACPILRRSPVAHLHSQPGILLKFYHDAGG